MIIQLYKDKFLEDIMMALAEAGVDDTIVLSGESLTHKMAFNMPLFAGFQKSVGSEKGYGNVIMSMADTEQVDILLDGLKSAGINFIEDGIGKIVLLPVEKIYE